MNKLLQLLSQKEHSTAWEIAEKQSSKPDTVYADTVKGLNSLVANGEASIIGKKYIASHGKLFDVYTHHITSVTERIAALLLKQKNAQILHLANVLYSEYKEHLNSYAIEQALELVKDGKSNIHIKYHALEVTDICAVYKNVLKNAASWLEKEKEYYIKPERTPSGSVRKYKIPY